jgi:Uma2 family endonuclease
MLQLAPGLVWIPDVVSDLVVEVLSKGNMPREVEQKLQDYFAAGIRLVWYVVPSQVTWVTSWPFSR